MKKIIFIVLSFFATNLAISQELKFSERDALLLQVSCLYFQDEFEYTQPNVNGYLYENNTILELKDVHEGNTLSKWFFDRGLWSSYYIVAIGATYLGSDLFQDFDNENLKNFPVKSQDLFLAGCSFMELYAISTWIKNGYGYPKVNCTFFIRNF